MEKGRKRGKRREGEGKDEKEREKRVRRGKRGEIEGKEGGEREKRREGKEGERAGRVDWAWLGRQVDHRLPRSFSCIHKQKKHNSSARQRVCRMWRKPLLEAAIAQRCQPVMRASALSASYDGVNVSS